MMDTSRLRFVAVLLLGAIVLTGAAWMRGAEYDEQYTVFLLAGDARPAWPASVFTPAQVRDRFHGAASPARIAADLRHQDVHPPLYFWAVSAWSRLVGDTLFRLRLFSVLCGLGALATVGLIARRTGLPAGLAMLLTLGCYAFAYTGGVARGFALAQLLALLGVSRLTLPPSLCRDAGQEALGAGRCVGAGLLLGAASFANYLAAFTAFPVLIWLAWHRLRDGMLAAFGFGVFVMADLFFFLAQRDSRPGQFPPFHLTDGLVTLGKFGAASVAGGLPLYVPANLAAPVSGAIVLVLCAAGLLIAARWRFIASPAARALLGGAVIATPAGLLLLGLAFDNTPIALRYLAFAMPYAALLLAGALASLSRAGAAICGSSVLALQAAAIVGLLVRPETMQPMRDAAREASRLDPGQTVLLLPRGNDGVGIVGAFVTEAPDTMRLLLVDRRTQAEALHSVAPRLALALLDRDAESHAALAAVLAGFADDPCWQALPGGFVVTVFASRCQPGEAQPGTAQTVAVSTAR
jgi:hypothetical protein